jgi:hypothetical protein
MSSFTPNTQGVCVNKSLVAIALSFLTAVPAYADTCATGTTYNVGATEVSCPAGEFCFEKDDEGDEVECSYPTTSVNETYVWNTQSTEEGGEVTVVSKDRLYHKLEAAWSGPNWSRRTAEQATDGASTVEGNGTTNYDTKWDLKVQRRVRGGNNAEFCQTKYTSSTFDINADPTSSSINTTTQACNWGSKEGEALQKFSDLKADPNCTVTDSRIQDPAYPNDPTKKIWPYIWTGLTTYRTSKTWMAQCTSSGPNWSSTSNYSFQSVRNDSI